MNLSSDDRDGSDDGSDDMIERSKRDLDRMLEDNKRELDDLLGKYGAERKEPEGEAAPTPPRPESAADDVPPSAPAPQRDPVSERVEPPAADVPATPPPATAAPVPPVPHAGKSSSALPMFAGVGIAAIVLIAAAVVVTWVVFGDPQPPIPGPNPPTPPMDDPTGPGNADPVAVTPTPTSNGSRPVAPRPVPPPPEGATGASAEGIPLPDRAVLARTLPPHEVQRLNAQLQATRFQTVDEAAGTSGNVQLRDGFQLTLPRGAVPAGTPARVRKMVASAESNGFLEDLVVYDISAGPAGERLTQPATLRFPLTAEEAQRLGDRQPAVWHYSRSGKVERLPARLTSDRRAIEAQTRSFSMFYRAIPTAYSRYAERVYFGRNVPEVIVPATFYQQGNTGWCWAASAAMMFGAQGKAVQPHAVAAGFDVGPQQGGSFWPLIGVDLRDTQRSIAGLNERDYIEQNMTGAVTSADLLGWVVHQLDQRRPVWLGLTNYSPEWKDHAILVVGYNKKGFYVHDPKGSAITVAKRYRNQTVNQTQLQKQLAYYHLTWGEMFSLIDYMPWFANLGVVHNPVDPARAKLVTAQVLTNGMQFHRHGVGGNITKTRIALHWNGKAPEGAGFSANHKDVNLRGLDGLCNSDQLKSLTVEVHNASLSQPFQGRVRLFINDTPMPGAASVTAGPRTTMNSVSVVERGGVAHGAGPDQFISLAQRASLGSVAAAFDLVNHPLRPGKYLLHVVLEDSSGQVMDAARFNMLVRPALVHRVTVERKEADEGVEHIVKWDASHDERRLGRGGCVYHVYHIPAQGSPRRVATVDPARGREWKRSVSGSQADQTTYHVSIVDRRSGLESPLSKEPTVTETSDDDGSGAEMIIEAAPRPPVRP